MGKRKWFLKIICISFYCLWLSGLYCQDVEPNSLLSLIPGILNDCDTSINNLETNTTASNKIMQDLSLTNNSMSITISMQQRELDRELENYRRLETAAQQKSQNYEAALQSLETSLTELSRDNKEKDSKILKLTETVSKMKTAVFVMGGILAAIAAYLIIRLALWIKGGAAVALTSKILQRFA